MVKVVLLREREELEVDYAGTVQGLLPHVGYSVETAVVLRNGTPIEESELVGEGDEITILPVVSGG